MTDDQRYITAMRAMQSGVALDIEHNPQTVSPKHLRVGLNSAMVTDAAMAGLLIDKGFFTREEYVKAIADQMEREAESYRKKISERLGGADITLA